MPKRGPSCASNMNVEETQAAASSAIALPEETNDEVSVTLGNAWVKRQERENEARSLAARMRLAMESWKTESWEWRKRAEKMEQLLQEAKNALEKEKGQTDRLKAMLADLSKELDLANARVAESSRVYDEVVAEKETAKEEAAALSASLAAEKQENFNLNEKFVQIESDFEKAKLECERLDKKTLTMQRSMKRKEEDIRVLNKVTAQKNKHVCLLVKEREKLSGKVRALSVQASNDKRTLKMREIALSVAAKNSINMGKDTKVHANIKDATQCPPSPPKLSKKDEASLAKFTGPARLKRALETEMRKRKAAEARIALLEKENQEMVVRMRNAKKHVSTTRRRHKK